MDIFKISNFYIFYYYATKNIYHQSYALACVKQSTVSIKLGQRVSNIEDKIMSRGVGNNDMIHVVLVQCLSTNNLCNEKTMCDIKVVEMMEKIRHKRMLLSSWSDTLEFYHVQIMDPFEVI
ncbi:hypothetical protein QL285_007604 [Trifolium repens]|nr:hypothetical protein QL285_007604 [Trifolium repens]